MYTATNITFSHFWCLNQHQVVRNDNSLFIDITVVFTLKPNINMRIVDLIIMNLTDFKELSSIKISNYISLITNVIKLSDKKILTKY